MTAIESGSSRDRARIEAWLAELKLSPQLGENAIEILRAWKNQFEYDPHSNGRLNYQSLLAASLYAAIKADPMCGGVTLHDFFIATKTSKKSVLRRYREIVLDMDVTPQACSMKPGPYLDALLMKVGADEKLKTRAVEILAEEMNQMGKNYFGNPVAVAGAVLYAAALIERRWMPLHRVAHFTGLAEQTVSNYVHLMRGQSAILARTILNN